MYNGKIKFQNQNFFVNELYGEDMIIGKYAIGFEMGQYTRIFTIQVKDDLSGVKRPAVFDTQEECIDFIKNLQFPQQYLKAVKIEEFLYKRDIFLKVGAYLLKKVSIILI